MNRNLLYAGGVLFAFLLGFVLMISMVGDCDSPVPWQLSPEAGAEIPKEMVPIYR